ncbi:MAG: NAD(P)/FAD-dependent oxidoreductase [Pseudonocardiaceae bacterium]|nr:NAD(P)/FAD-dependent oxidoreductase [Pseudonocardiaceae bacterium]
MSSENTFVIVGAGLAGAKAAEILRAEGFAGRVHLVGAEAERPYERPPLSKDYLTGAADRESIYVHEAGWHDTHAIELYPGVRAERFDPTAHEVELDTGERVGYQKLLLTTGSSARRLPVPGAALDGVHYLRTAADSDRLRTALSGGSRQVVVVGAGWIGLEAAAAARHHGNAVTVVEPQPTPLHQVLGPEMGGVFARLHREHGVDLRLQTTIHEIRGMGGHVDSVVTDHGDELPADVVLIGVGAAPNTELADTAGLTTGNGIVVDAALRTSARDVYAAGDVAAAFHPRYGRHVRVEHWANALHGGPAAARSMLGQQVNYDRLPYFFTDQYDLGMEYTGLGSADATVICRGNPADGAFIAFWLTDGRVEAGMNVNTWDVTDAIQALIRSTKPVDTDLLTDPAVPLEDLL